MKDFEQQKTDSPQDAPHGIVKPKGHSHAEGQDASHVASQPASHPHADPAALSAPELSHPANAAPLADLLTQLQQSHGNIHVQRVVSEMSELKSDPESKSGSAQSLDAGIKTEMESAFGESFSDVRVHTDSQAEKATDELGARAFTRGRDVYFGSGEYKPSTREGKELLAHELTHVVQQKGGMTGVRASSIGESGDTFEQEADRAAASIERGERVHVEQQRTTAPAFQRDPKQAQQPPARTFPTPTIDVTTNPNGTLPNGVSYRYLPPRPGLFEYTLDFVIPEGMTVLVNSRNRTDHHYVTERAGNVRAAIIVVTGRQGESATALITFVHGGARSAAIFHLPRLP